MLSAVTIGTLIDANSASRRRGGSSCSEHLSHAGLHPVVALYSTFLNRAFDQLLLDVALHGEAVTLVLDRAGVTGNDGPSHNGMWDLSLLGIVPGMRVAAPRDATRLRQLLRESVEHDTGPTALRFPKASVADGSVEVTVNAQQMVIKTVVEESYLDDHEFGELGDLITEAAQAASREVGRK